MTGAADGILAGGAICLIAWLSHLLVTRDHHMSRELEQHSESHRLMNDGTANAPTHNETYKSKPSDPEMSFVDLSSGLDEEQTSIIPEGKRSGGFRAYLNRMNMPEIEMEEGLYTSKGDKDEVRIQPALMPQVRKLSYQASMFFASTVQCDKEYKLTESSRVSCEDPSLPCSTGIALPGNVQ